MVKEEFDLLEDRLTRLIEGLKERPRALGSGEKGLKAENKELNRKIRLVKAKIKKMLKEVDRIEGQVDINGQDL